MMHVERITPIFKFKRSMLKSSLCDYSDAHRLVCGTITVKNTGTAAVPNNIKDIIIKNCVPFTDCVSEINNTQIDNEKDIDVVIPMYNLIEYSDNYSKSSGSLWQYYRDEPFSDYNDVIVDFLADNNNSSAPFKFKTKIAGRIGNNGTKDVKIMVPLKYLSNFIRELLKCH